MTRSTAAGSRRRWTFRLVALVGLPLVVLAALELGLRAVAFGYDAAFVRTCTRNGVAEYCDNPDFSRSFFPRSLARPPLAFTFPADKAPTTLRVFLVGGSAAQGDPDPTFGPSRMLELMLAERYPLRRFEVVNAAVTAINSHVVRTIVRDLARFEPDLFIVFVGNNEVVGPYGAGTVFAPMLSRPLIRASIAARRTRLGQLVSGLVDAGSAGSAEWRGMEMFLGQPMPADDPRMAEVYRNFEANLRAIVDTALDAGAGVVLTTVPTNLVDCAPFASSPSAALAPAERERADRLVEQSDRVLATDGAAAALEPLLAAERIDGADAELQYRIGRLRIALGQSDAARPNFVAARDLDLLRFRADSTINRRIRDVAEAVAGPLVALADAESRFAAVSPHGLPGEELFLEHVHPTFAGNYLIALGWLEQIASVVPGLEPADSGKSLPDADELARRLAYSDFDRRRVWKSVESRVERPPFTGQLDHLARLQRVADRTGRSTPIDWPAVLDTYDTAIAARPGDPWLRFNLAGVLAEIGDHDRAAAELLVFLVAFPHDPAARERLCRAEIERGRFDSALAECQRVIERIPHHTPPYYATAFALASLGRLDEAVSVYRRLLALEPDAAPEILNEIGRIEMHRSRHDAAVAVYREALDAARGRLLPDVRFNYASALRASGDDAAADRAFAAAETDYRQAVELDPTAVAPLLALGRCLVQLGRYDAAIETFERAARLDPTRPEPYLAIVRALERQGVAQRAADRARDGARVLEQAGRAAAAAALRREAARLERPPQD
ncbi:MAG TPA: tetratricopeptide repeat protein [Candidatus Polarisedimenticolaceae bacterium]|nr:tetratricopeptide repeat protein [Candidatus Polarisedimenticolaceae bacterium]